MSSQQKSVSPQATPISTRPSAQKQSTNPSKPQSMDATSVAGTIKCAVIAFMHLIITERRTDCQGRPLATHGVCE
jgi:hypothetical protein